MLANPNLRALIRITPMHWHGKQNLAQAANRSTTNAPTRRCGKPIRKLASGQLWRRLCRLAGRQPSRRVLSRTQLQNGRFRVKMAEAALENLRELENRSEAAKD
ncbi:hypothetical protein [Ralstonia sp.]|uniref:hypothetical protein n=1 Tax=Ralstonia sp. TaxID=54061 RepID=UPI002C62FC5E|nr:hypothetical protein [Ralstonia sp.]HWV06103.1 hypothetical protein [Ralstonia sp.]